MSTLRLFFAVSFILWAQIASSSSNIPEERIAEGKGSGRFTTCTVASAGRVFQVPILVNYGVHGRLVLHCENKETSFFVSMKNAGALSFRVLSGGKFGMMCTSSDPRGQYYGLKLGGYLFAGGDSLIIAGKKGICALSGATVGLQAGVDVSLLSVEIE